MRGSNRSSSVCSRSRGGRNVAQSLSLADRGYVLENGRIVMTGSGAELLADDGVRRAYVGL